MTRTLYVKGNGCDWSLVKFSFKLCACFKAVDKGSLEEMKIRLSNIPHNFSPCKNRALMARLLRSLIQGVAGVVLSEVERSEITANCLQWDALMCSKLLLLWNMKVLRYFPHPARKEEIVYEITQGCSRTTTKTLSPERVCFIRNRNETHWGKTRILSK